ncbi:unnamed protein product [Zymoseptoria tritici ST99CH_1E4]|uniref:Uncharacterized protein n=1 Tax=Zymoseptoria tritici ST99CH_1E4 TaxID=1276532 RepID=A0A2H1FZS6_ZYMTR|nr:unnamed protein product [Zymoseptoria tritici ST99CH_1E4]
MFGRSWRYDRNPRQERVAACLDLDNFHLANPNRDPSKPLSSTEPSAYTKYPPEPIQMAPTSALETLCETTSKDSQTSRLQKEILRDAATMIKGPISAFDGKKIIRLILLGATLCLQVEHGRKLAMTTDASEQVLARREAAVAARERKQNEREWKALREEQAAGNHLLLRWMNEADEASDRYDTPPSSSN